MTPLPELLTRAAGTEPAGFDAADVRRGVARRERRQRMVLAAAVLLVIVALAVAAVGLAGGDDDAPVVDRPSRGPLTTEELEGGVWVVRSFSIVTSVEGPVPLAFADGRLLGGPLAGCSFDGAWGLVDSRLRTSDLRWSFPECEPSAGVALLFDVLASSPEVGRIGGGAGTLELRSGADVVGLRRVDRIGQVPTADDLTGDWEDGTMPVTFSADGTLAVEACAGDPIAGTWELDGGQITIGLTDGFTSGACTRMSVGDGDPYDGTSTVRIEGDLLYLATSRVVIVLER